MTVHEAFQFAHRDRSLRPIGPLVDSVVRDAERSLRQAMALRKRLPRDLAYVELSVIPESGNVHLWPRSRADAERLNRRRGEIARALRVHTVYVEWSR